MKLLPLDETYGLISVNYFCIFCCCCCCSIQYSITNVSRLPVKPVTCHFNLSRSQRSDFFIQRQIQICCYYSAQIYEATAVFKCVFSFFLFSASLILALLSGTHFHCTLRKRCNNRYFQVRSENTFLQPVSY